MNKSLLFLSFLFISVGLKAQNWQQVVSGSFDDLNSVSYGSATHVYATGFNPSILKSTNGGTNWTSLSTNFLPPGSTLLSCDFVSKDTGMVVGGDSLSGFIYKTTNGGATWTAVLTGAPTILTSIMFPTAQVGYAIGGQLSLGAMYKTVNGGDTWTAIYSGGPNMEYNSSVHFADNNNGHMVGMSEDPIIGTFEGQTMKVSGGIPAAPVISPLYFLFTDVYFRSADTGYVTALDFNGSYILKTTNGGTSWSSIYSNLNDDLNTITFVNSQLGYAAGTTGLIVKTTNGGATWTSMTTPVGDDLASIEFFDANSGIIVGSAGTILKTVVCTGVPTTATLNIPPSCIPVIVNGQTYSSSGTYTQVLTNSAGCDSTLTIVVVVNTSSTTLMNQTACQMYQLNGQTYTTSGSYSQNFINAAGCDSVIQLNLTVINPNINLTQVGPTLTSSASGVSYQWLKCSPYSIIAGATNQSYTATSNGTYAVVVTQAGCKDTSLCKTVTGVGIEEVDALKFSISPNPSTGKFVLQSDKLNESVVIKVSNMQGQTVYTNTSWSGASLDIDLTKQPKGIYFVSLVPSNIGRLNLKEKNFKLVIE